MSYTTYKQKGILALVNFIRIQLQSLVTWERMGDSSIETRPRRALRKPKLLQPTHTSNKSFNVHWISYKPRRSVSSSCAFVQNLSFNSILARLRLSLYRRNEKRKWISNAVINKTCVNKIYLLLSRADFET